MKKFFLFVAAVAAALTVNAEVRDFTAVSSEADYIISTNGVSKNSGSTDAKIVYDLAANNDLTVDFDDQNASFFYPANKDAKTKFFTVEFGKYVEVGGKGFELTVYGVNPGDKLVFLVANKSDKGAGSFEALDGCSGDPVALPKKDKTAAGADEWGYTWVEAEFVATSSTVKVTETGYGFRIKTIAIGEGQGITNTKAGVKAIKRFENGQLVIIKNGVRYNAIGVQL